MEKEKDGIYLMPDWFQEKAREQVRKEMADASGGDQTQSKAATKAAMQKAVDDLLGDPKSGDQETIKHKYI